MQGLSVPVACVGSGDPVGAYVCTQRIHWMKFEAFIAETYVQLVATKSTCYSTGWLTRLNRLRAGLITLWSLTK